MKTFLLTWNPKKWEWSTLKREVSATARGSRAERNWSCAHSKKPRPGDRFFHLRQGVEPKGIIGSGWIVRGPTPDGHYSARQASEGKTTNYVGVVFDTLLDPEIAPPLPRSALDVGVLGAVNWDTQASGIEVAEPAASELEELWYAHLKKPLPPQPLTLAADPELAALEGAAKERLVLHRERESALRHAKVREAQRRSGGRLVCEVPGCGFDFFERYGEIGRDFAHVHHLKPLSERTRPTKTKLSELAVVCANCHAMIHVGGECRPLKRLIKG